MRARTANRALISLRKLTPPRAEEDLTRVLAGDADWVDSLLFKASNKDREKIAHAIWRLGVGTDVLRATIEAAWRHDHRFCLAAFGWDMMKAFRDAEFPTDHLPEQLTIWRGVSWPKVNGPEEDTGLSWTLNRDIACWFALRLPNDQNEPFVIRRVVDRASVLAHITSRDEDEIIVEPIDMETWEVDGDLKDWQAASDRFVRQKAE